MSKAAIQELLSALSEKGDDGIIHRTFGVTVKADTIDKKARSVRVIASTDSIDSYDEIVEQDWEKRLGRYKKNPVVLYNHNKSGFLGMGGAACDTLPIGSASDVRMVDGHLEATLHFVDDLANPMGEKVWQGFLQGSIRAVSVGFMPHSVREEKQNDVEILRLCDNELYEISAVAMPANADAVALSAESGSERQRLRARARAAQEPNLTALAEKAKIQMDLAEQLKKAQDDLVAAAKAIETEKSLSAEHKTAAETAQTALQTSETALKALETELEELKAKNALTTTEKEASEAKLIELEVDALVGKKIAPAEKADFIALRTTDPKRFKSMVANRADMPHTKSLVADDNKSSKSKSSSGNLSNARKSAAGK